MTEPNAATPTAAHVYFAPGTTAEQQATLYEGLAGLGVRAQGAVVGNYRSATLTWMVLVVLPLSGFLQECGKNLAQDAYRELKGVIGGALRRTTGTAPEPEPVVEDDPVLMLEDAETTVRLVFTPDLPDDAFRQLFDLDLSSSPGRTMRYVSERNRWE
ncbi:hypothetical protein [Streptomyces sp. HD]|uniref:hypothetical protein n=1 Tax=Streptomyces sp. HD TaxID=3020892 RepID=UPI00232D324E|nr:hypothetical protein [Streptomyces sp. HD]MDC0772721.1 hypothetical protein [Streptomyces sp. HD]